MLKHHIRNILKTKKFGILLLEDWIDKNSSLKLKNNLEF